MWGARGCSQRSDVAKCGCPDVTPLECAVADRHRVLQVFSRNPPPSSPLEATLTRVLIGVHSKGFRVKLTLLDATLTRNTGQEAPHFLYVPTFGRSDWGTCRRSGVPPPVPLQPNAFGATIPKGTRFLHHPGKQLRSPRCLRLRERTSGTVHRRSRSKTPTRSGSQVVPGDNVLTQRAF